MTGWISVLVSLYFLTLVLAVVASTRLLLLAPKHLHNSGEQFISPYPKRWIYYSFLALAAYYTINLSAECAAWFHMFLKRANYSVYTFNYALNLMAIFFFFAINVKNRFFTLFLVLIYGCFIYFFIDERLWLARAPIPFMFGVLLFSGMSVISIVFLATNLITHSGHPNWFKIQLGIVFALYNFLALFFSVFVLDHQIHEIGYWFFFFSNTILATCFYGCSAWVMFKLAKKWSHGN